MAVIVQYVVVKDGVEKMTFTTKKEADAYDKMLDVAESLYGFLEKSNIEIDDDKLDELTFYIAQNSDEVASILKGSSAKKPKESKSDSGKAAKTKADSSITDESADAVNESTEQDTENKDAA